MFGNVPILGWFSGSGGGGGGGTYQGAFPTNFPWGNIPPGTNLFGMTYDAIIQMATIAYLSPSFNALTSTVFNTFEVGQPIPSGLQSIGYTVNNSVNIKAPQPPNVGVPSSNIPGATFPINPFLLLPAGSFQIDIPPGFTEVVPTNRTIGLQGTNSNNITFSTSNNILFRQRVFWGTSPLTVLTETDIEALSNSQLRNGFAGTYSFAAGNYKWVCYPTSMGLATTFTDTGTGFPVAMVAPITVSVTNPYGVTENYYAHRTLNILGGSINIAVAP